MMSKIAKGRMEQRLSCLSICVDDIATVRAFYEAMGWTASPLSREIMPIFNANGFVFMVVGRKLGMEEAFGMPLPLAVAPLLDAPPAFSGVLLSYVVRSDENVDAILAQAVASGGSLLRPGKEQPWGNYSGYFADPAGTVWEVSLTRRTQVRDDGTFRIDG